MALSIAGMVDDLPFHGLRVTQLFEVVQAILFISCIRIEISTALWNDFGHSVLFEALELGTSHMISNPLREYSWYRRRVCSHRYIITIPKQELASAQITRILTLRRCKPPLKRLQYILAQRMFFQLRKITAKQFLLYVPVIIRLPLFFPAPWEA